MKEYAKKCAAMLITAMVTVSLLISGITFSAAAADALPANAEQLTADTKTLKDGVTYYVAGDLTINGNKANKNGLAVENNTTATLYIPAGVTLSVYGRDGSGTTGGGAAILLPNGATLIVVGNGKLVAVGGNAAAGGAGGNGSRSYVNDDTDGSLGYGYPVYQAGSGGSGGYGGGGAGAGIGTDGGTGGFGLGSGASGWGGNDDGIRDSGRNGYSGSTGAGGSSAAVSGTFICANSIDVSGVKGGNAGSSGSSGDNGLPGFDGDNGDARGIAGGAGGGGGGGGHAGAGIGTGGGGGGQGGGGGSAGYIWSGRYVGGGGGGGGGGAVGGHGGTYGSFGKIQETDCENTRYSAVTAHTIPTIGGRGSNPYGGSGGVGANMTITSNDDEKTRGIGGIGGSGGSSGNAATAYVPNDASGKYILLLDWSGSDDGGFGFTEGQQSLSFDLNTLYWNDAVPGEDDFYYILCDENGNPILDSNGNEIRGELTFADPVTPGSGSTPASLILPEGLTPGKYTLKVGAVGAAQGELPAGGFEIEAKPLDEDDVAVSFDDAEISVKPPVFSGTDIEPEVDLSYGGKDLVEGIDYLVTYSNNINAGENTASVTVTFIGNYSGSITKNFSIAKCDPEITIAADQNAVVYNRLPAAAENNTGRLQYAYNGDGFVTVKWYADESGEMGTEIPAPTDIGTYWFSASAAETSNCTAAAEVAQKFTIIPYCLQADDITLIPDAFTYNTADQSPVITVKHGDATLNRDTECAVSNETTGKNANTYTVTITGTGNYTGTVNKTWTIHKATPEVTDLPAAAAIAWGRSLAASTLNGGTAVLNGAPVSGTFVWKEPDTIPTPADGDTTPYAVIFIPEDSGNYNAVEMTVTVTVHLTVTFDTANGSNPSPITDALYGQLLSEPSAPTRRGYVFAGWFKDAERRQAWNFERDTLAANLTLYAKWSRNPVYSVSGSVTQNGAPIEGATVEIKRGSEVVSSTVTDSNGSYTADYLPDGDYNIVITDGDKVTTGMITVSGGAVTNANVAASAGKVSSGIEIVAVPEAKHAMANTEGTLVGGLDAIAAKQSPAAGEHITIRLVVTPMQDVTGKKEHPDKAPQDAIRAIASGRELEHFDLKLTRTVAADGVSGTPEDIGGSNMDLLRIVIPFNTDNSRSIAVYRYHNGTAEAMTKNPADGEEGYEVGTNRVIIHARKFSPYAIGYIPFSTEPQHEVALPKAENGTVTLVSPDTSAGSTVTITATPDAGREVSRLTVTDQNGKEIEVTRKSDGTYTFVMPDGKVTIDVRFAPTAELCPRDETCPIHGYTDIHAAGWYHDGVHYCLRRGLMKGVTYTSFAPNDITTRAQLVTVLWRLEGEPLVPAAEGFRDVYENDWYNNSIRWATANGIAEGYGENVFGPNDAVTRQQMAAILWRYCKYKGYDVSIGEDANILSYYDAFDVAGYAMPAMQWACGAGIIQGIEKNGSIYLDPNGNAIRSQCAVMIYRFCAQ